MRGTVRAKRARAAGLAQWLKRCVAMCCDAQRRVAARYDAPRRVALPTVISISPTRLIETPTWCSREATSRQRCCHKAIYVNMENAMSSFWIEKEEASIIVFPSGVDSIKAVEKPETIIRGA